MDNTADTQPVKNRGFKYRLKRFLRFIYRSIRYGVVKAFKTLWFSLLHPRKAFWLFIHLVATLLTLFWVAFFVGLEPTSWPYVPTTFHIALASVFVFVLYCIGALFRQRKKAQSTEA